MQSLTLYIATSLDGYIARPDGAVDWLFDGADGEDFGYGAFFQSVGSLIMGRETYEAVRAFGEPWPYAAKPVYVFSARPADATAPAGVQFVSEDAAAFTQRLLAAAEAPVWLVGGGRLFQSLWAAGMVDRLFLFVHPVTLGRGLPLFAPDGPERPLRLLDAHAWPNGLLALAYAA